MSSVRRAQNPDSSLADNYRRVRITTVELCHSLELEDYVIQSMPEVSPAKWHLAHTSWFFERFVLTPFATRYKPFDPTFDYLFNSYYYTVGKMHPRAQRGLLSRPSVATIMAFRHYVDNAMVALLSENAANEILTKRVILGLNHEQQHQELLLTDIKHVFSVNPLKPAWRELSLPASNEAPTLQFQKRPAATVTVGYTGERFCFDNETPCHDELVVDHSIATRLITNREFIDFIRDGAYSTPTLWLSDGWATVQSRHWRRPFYWTDDLCREFTLGGMRELDLNAPVSHLSYYEADAFARWADARLPTEAEWESFAADKPVAGNFADAGRFHPAASPGNTQLFGDVWEWTASPYTHYPGYKPLAGALGEYNGKFMCNQFVLRGGSCVTPSNHVRASYRNFFPPATRWQCAGLRLAKNA